MSIGLMILTGWVVMAIVMAALWAIQRRTHNAGVVDVAWSIGTGLLGVWFAFGASGDPHRRMLVALMAAIWGVRLGLHLIRRVAAEAEDGRYQMLRARWGDRTQMYLFWFFQIQAAWAVMFALPMMVAASNPTEGIQWYDVVGAAIYILSFVGESVADAQLARFRREQSNRGQVCQSGLWRYSRHPNYFFEWIHWFAYVAIGIAGSWGCLTVLGPVVMYCFLRYVTGIPMTEERAIRSRGDAYRTYQHTTSAFFPWPPKVIPLR